MPGLLSPRCGGAFSSQAAEHNVQKKKSNNNNQNFSMVTRTVCPVFSETLASL